MRLGPDAIRKAVAAVYDAVGLSGSHGPGGLAVPTGRALAQALGYPAAELAEIPSEVADAFVGCAAVACSVEDPPRGWVVDLGCGAGLDAALLARRGHRVAALDVSPSMLRRLRQASGGGSGLALPILAVMPSLPLRTGAATWVILNGAANLVPERRGLLAEILRVLEPGGWLLAADLVALGEIPEEVRELPEAWAWCIGGASSSALWEADLQEAGFVSVDVAIVEKVPPLGRGLIRAQRPPEGA